MEVGLRLESFANRKQKIFRERIPDRFQTPLHITLNCVHGTWRRSVGRRQVLVRSWRTYANIERKTHQSSGS